MARILGSGQTVSIYALAVGEVTLTAQLPNGAKATCQIIVEADKTFSFENQTVRVCPTRTKSVRYEASPADAAITWLLADGTYASNVVNNGDGTGTITFTPTSEGEETVAINAYNPAVGKVFQSTSVQLEFRYKTLTLIPTISKSTGDFSKIDGDHIYVGDGETFNLNFAVAEEGTNWQINSLTFEPSQE